jgi:secondary thiamine-phosphate synthase enzyme
MRPYLYEPISNIYGGLGGGRALKAVLVVAQGMALTVLPVVLQTVSSKVVDGRPGTGRDRVGPATQRNADRLWQGLFRRGLRDNRALMVRNDISGPGQLPVGLFALKILRHRIEVATTEPLQLLDITEQVRDWVASTGISDGLLTLISPHTTARLNINEREPQLQRDMITYLKRLVPRDGDYLHNLKPVDGRDNAHSHLLGLFMNASETIPVADGKLLLGEWQSIFFIELDGPRDKRGIELQISGND